MDIYFFYYPGYQNDKMLVPYLNYGQKLEYVLYLVIKSFYEKKLITNIGNGRCITCHKNTYVNCDNVFLCYQCQLFIKSRSVKHIKEIATEKMVLIYFVFKHYVVIDIINYIIHIPLKNDV